MTKETEKVALTIPYDSGFTHVLFNLAGQGYSHIIVDYSGGGDEGAVNDVMIVENGNLTETEDKWIIKDNYTPLEPNDELLKLLEDTSYDRILNNLNDWWNNEGGGGRLFISTHNNEYHCEHYINVTIEKEETLTGTLTD